MKSLYMPMVGLIMVILLSGCFNGIRIPLGDGNSIQFSSGDEGVSFQLQGEEGSMSFSAEDGMFVYDTPEGKATVYREMPEHFPSELPVPDNVDAIGDFVTEVELEDGSTVFALAFVSDADREEEINQLYDTFLADQQFTVEETADEMGKTVSAENDQSVFNMGIYSDEAGVTVTLHYTIKGD